MMAEINAGLKQAQSSINFHPREEMIIEDNMIRKAKQNVSDIENRLSKKTVLAGRSRTAGMMIDGYSSTISNYTPGFVLESYRNSYASGLGIKSGVYDIPSFITLMNSKNGGIIQWPSCLQEKFSWFRWYARSDALVGRALDLLTDLPRTKITLTIPKFVPEERRSEVKELFEDQVRTLNLFQKSGDILYERNCIGMTYLFCEWDVERRLWKRIQMLPPEEVFVFEIGFSEEKRIEYRPRRYIQMLQGNISDNNNGLEEEIVSSVPKEIVDSITSDGYIALDWNHMNGSFCECISRRKSPYMDVSPSIIDRILVPLQLKDFYKFTQLALASRNMSPKYLLKAPNATPEELEDLRMQWDISYNEPDYSIAGNYEYAIEKLDSRDRLLDISSEIERLDNEIYVGLGITKEMLTGEGSYAGSKTTTDILNTMFTQERETLVDFFENKLFIPICEARGWYTVGENGIKKYWCPKVGFNRLTIRDNDEVFQNLFQLYQKGSLPIEIIYELFNLDVSEIEEKIYKDLFTVRDASFNELIRNLLSEAASNLGEKSNFSEIVAKYLNLKIQGQPQEGNGEGGIPDFSSLLGGQAGGQESGGQEAPQTSDESNKFLQQALAPVLGESITETGVQEPSKEEPEEEKLDINSISDAVAEELPSDASPEEIIQKLISKEKQWDDLTKYEREVVIDDCIRDLPSDATPQQILEQIIIKAGGL